jgi:hypothetical protein
LPPPGVRPTGWCIRTEPALLTQWDDRGVMRTGTRADVAPTVLDRLGFDLNAIQPPLDGESLMRPAQKVATPDTTEKPRRPRRPGPGNRRALREQ